jgi:hypothetical protein
MSLVELSLGVLFALGCLVFMWVMLRTRFPGA